MTSTHLPRPGKQEELYAAIDLGSNSFHLLVVRVTAGSVQIIGKVKQKVRLAAGLDDQMVLDELSMERGWKCLETFAERLQDIPRSNIKAVATATLRIAKNAEVFIEKAENILQQKLEVISGEEEARQIYLGVAYTSANQGNSLVIDIGGASTEIIVGNDMQPMHLVSLDMGCVTYMERYFKGGVINAENFANAKAAAKALLEPVAGDFTSFTWQQCLGASGTPQAIIEILVTQDISDAIRHAYLENLQQQCIDCGSIDNLDIEGLTDARRVIFPSGLAILTALFECLHIDNMNIAGGALREGLIYGMLDTESNGDRGSDGIKSAMQRFHIDITHATVVRNTAMSLCQQVCDQLGGCNFDTRTVIESAALLHETGLHIEYKKYHEHGAYILKHYNLPGLTSLQKKAIIDLVLTHRQDFDPSVFASYHDEVRDQLINMARVLRLSTVLCIRRKDNLLPDISLTVEDQHWILNFPDGWLKAHPLIDAELANEAWLQHKAGWKLTCE